jgi:hypothetical protein
MSYSQHLTEFGCRYIARSSTLVQEIDGSCLTIKHCLNHTSGHAYHLFATLNPRKPASGLVKAQAKAEAAAFDNDSECAIRSRRCDLFAPANAVMNTLRSVRPREAGRRVFSAPTAPL